MKKIMSVAVVALVAGTMSLAAPTQAEARGILPFIGIGIAAGVVGYFVGTALSEGFERNWDGRWDTHHNRCKARYRSYDPWTDTFVMNNGHHHLCRL